MKNLRRKLKGWALNINADIKRKRKSLPEEFDLLDVFSELNQLTDLERKRMPDIQEELEDIWKIEETKAKQRSRDRNIKEGDMNTAYFHAICNHKARKKTILSLQGPDGMVTENKEMLGLAVDFYKKLFGYEEKIDIHLDENFWEESDYITAEENNLLEAPLSEEEIKEAVFRSYADGAPGPDGFPFLFYQKFWEVIKTDLMNMVRKFEVGELDIARLNYVMLTLISKEVEATELEKFRPENKRL